MYTLCIIGAIMTVLNEGSIQTVQARQTADLNSILDLAWAAGFIDGEGCIHIAPQKYGKNKEKVYYRLRLHIGQNNFEALDKVKSSLGEHGNIIPIKRTTAVNRQVYTLNYDGVHAYKVIMKLMPFLIRKKCEAQAANEFWVKGRLEEKTGRKPVRPELLKIREHWYRKLQKLK